MLELRTNKESRRGELGVVEHTFNPSTLEVETFGSLSGFKAILVYLVRPILKRLRGMC